MLKRFFGLLILGIVYFASSNAAHAVLKIDITRGNVDPLPIALPNIVPDSPSSTDNAADIMRVIQSDLEGSGLFKSIDRKAFIEEINKTNLASPTFSSWRQIDAQALVTGTLIDRGAGKIQVDFRLWDVFSQKQIAGKSFVAEQNNWRRIAHLVSDEIYRKLTGEEGYFDSRIVYVSESGSGKRPVKRLAIMDQDGANHKFLTDGRSLVLTPRFSPNSQKILYLSYASRKPRVYLRDIETGREEIMGDFQGMTFAPRFSPNGNKVLLSATTPEGNSDIYVMDLASKSKRKISNDGSINTSPSFSADESKIVFNSDRGGSQQLYVMDAGGGGVKRISFGEGKYGTPVWSPRGDLIAFTKMNKGRFYIGVMRPDGSGERLLTESYLVEGPTWSPNGRVIIFTRQEQSSGGQAGSSRLYSIDLTGHNERELITPTNASDPAWSPLLK